MSVHQRDCSRSSQCGPSPQRLPSFAMISAWACCSARLVLILPKSSLFLTMNAFKFTLHPAILAPSKRKGSFMRLQNRVALVTGAAMGIGKAVALLFAKEGARIVAADLNDTAA